MWKNKSEKSYEVTLLFDQEALPENIEEITVELKPSETNVQTMTASKTTEGEGHETFEHIKIGDEGFQYFFEQLTELDPEGYFIKYIPFANHLKNKDNKLKLEENFELTPGEIVALAGDYFGLPKQPIGFAIGASERQKRFHESYQTLINPENRVQIQEILQHTEEQSEPSLTLHKKSDGQIKSTFIYSWITRAGNTPLGVCHSRYMGLAANNFDHFGNEAALAFEAGLSLAVEQAEKARREKKDDNKKRQCLKEAILYVLFACHFLTDLYAAGHVNTPRKELLNALTHQSLDAIPKLENISSAKLILAGLLAKRMHDENSKNSIWVKNLGDKENWQMYGDGNYAHPNNKENAKKVIEAVALALKDVFLIYMGNPDNTPLFLNTFRQVIPSFSEEQSAKHNYKPLFNVASDKSHIEMRQSDGCYGQLTLKSALKESCHIKVRTTGTNLQTLSPEQVETLASQYEETPEGIRCTLI